MVIKQFKSLQNVKLTKDEIFLLLEYLIKNLRGKDFALLRDLPLVPLADGTYGKFSEPVQGTLPPTAPSSTSPIVCLVNLG